MNGGLSKLRIKLVWFYRFDYLFIFRYSVGSMPTLFVVATPLGNLKDITVRAKEILAGADIIACEDTRHSAILAKELGLSSPLVSYHQHSGEEKILGLLRSGKKVALITDAGTPGLADPGNLLVKKCVAENIEVVGLPGPNACILALSISGFKTDQFYFAGFLPQKKGRMTALKNLENLDCAIVLYESPHRAKKLIKELGAMWPDRQAMVARELTKKFETIYRGTLKDLVLMNLPERGEYVVVIDELKK